MMTIEVKDLVTILNDDDEGNKVERIIVLFDHMIPTTVNSILWDTAIFISTHPRRGSVGNMRILDTIYNYYNDHE